MFKYLWYFVGWHMNKIYILCFQQLSSCNDIGYLIWDCILYQILLLVTFIFSFILIISSVAALFHAWNWVNMMLISAKSFFQQRWKRLIMSRAVAMGGLSPEKKNLISPSKWILPKTITFYKSIIPLINFYLVFIFIIFSK